MLKWWNSTNSPCGTAGCMAGHAANIPEFKELGLVRGFGGSPEYRGAWGHLAMARLLDIPRPDAERLFRPSDPPDLLGVLRDWTRAKAVDVLERYLATGELP